MTSERLDAGGEHRGGVTPLELGILVPLALVVAVYVMHAGRGLTHHFDAWGWITQRRGLSAHSLLGPHNGHLSLVPVLEYKAGLAAFGLSPYWPFRLAVVLLHLLCSGLLLVLVRRRVGVVGGIIACALLLVCGAAAEDLVWGFQVGFLSAVAAGLAAFVGLDRRDRTGDLLAMVALAVAVASASVGIPFLIAAIVEVAWQRTDRRERWWVVVVPLVLYVVWYLAYGEAEAKLSNLPAAPPYAVSMASSAAGGLLGLGIDTGRVLAVGVIALVAWHVAAGRRFDGRTAALIVAPVAFWGLTALGRADLGEPEASRYVYPSAVLLLLVVAEVLRGQRATLRVGLVGVAAVAVAAVGNAGFLDDFASGLRGVTDNFEARAGVVDLLGPRVPPSFEFAPVETPQIDAGSFRVAERDFGRVSDTPAELAAAPLLARQSADAALAAIVPIAVAPVRDDGGAAPPAIGAVGLAGTSRGRCLVLRRSGPAATSVEVDLRVAPGATFVVRDPTGPVSFAIRRFGDGFTPVGGPAIAAGATREVALLPDADAARPYDVQLTTTGPLRVCGG